MKKNRIFLLALLIFSFISQITYAQIDVEEPDFVGEVLLVTSDNTATLLEKSPAQFKTQAGATVHIFGIGSVKNRIIIKGCCSKVRTNKTEDIKLIVRSIENYTDPYSIINVFQFESKKKERRAELSSTSTFGGTSDNNLMFIPFTAEKYGESSYLLTISPEKTGEFGVLVSNLNGFDERVPIVASFGIDPADD